MALINCPECGRENVSDSAESCPNCGYNIKAHFARIHAAEMTNTVKSEVSNVSDSGKKFFSRYKIIICILLLLLIGFTIFLGVRKKLTENPMKVITPTTSMAKLYVMFGIPRESNKNRTCWSKVNFFGLEGTLEIHRDKNSQNCITWRYVIPFVLPDSDDPDDIKENLEKIYASLEELTGDYRSSRSSDSTYLPEGDALYRYDTSSYCDFNNESYEISIVATPKTVLGH